MIKTVKISPSYVLVNDKYLYDNLMENSKERVDFFITEREVEEAYTDDEILGFITNASVATFEKAVQAMLDNTARSKGYDNVLSACTYAVARGRFQQEGIKFAEWRTDVWAYCYEELDKIQQGLRTTPTVEQFLNELPQLVV